MAEPALDSTETAELIDREIPNKPGIYNHRRGLWIEVIEPRSFKTHRHFRASLPHSNGIEEGFQAGPVFSVYSESGIVDVVAGLSLLNGTPVRQTAVVRKLIDNYPEPTAEEIGAAHRLDRSEIALPLASQRMRNYCRWWLDSIGKLYVCTRSDLLRMNMRSSTLSVVIPRPETTFQRSTLDLLNWTPPVKFSKRARFLRGRSINSSGLAYGGGQNIGAIVRQFSQFLELVFPDRQQPSGATGERLFISRNEAPMRRLLDEQELIPLLRDLGFTIFYPAKTPLNAQIDAFRKARVVLGAHGAGLTNIAFCRPGTTLIEIFPEGGVHGSAFSRIASHLCFDYYYIAGQSVENSRSEKNPNNADIRLDLPSVASFIKQAIDASGTS